MKNFAKIILLCLMFCSSLFGIVMFIQEDNRVVAQEFVEIEKFELPEKEYEIELLAEVGYDFEDDDEVLISEVANLLLIVLGISFLVSLIIIIWVIHAFSRRKNGETGKSVWGWIGVNLLMIIPFVSTILLFVWAFGEKTKNDYTFRSWARLNLTMMLFATLFVISLIISFLIVIGSLKA